MMDGIRQYLISVTAAAVICSIITAFAGKKGTGAAMTRMLCGIFMAITLLSPLLQIRLSDISWYFAEIQSEGEAAAEVGVMQTKESMAAIIKDRTQTYILDKASSMELELTVEVTVSDEEIPQPCRVYITGPAAPYPRQQLQKWIEQTLGIPKEDQSWI